MYLPRGTPFLLIISRVSFYAQDLGLRSKDMASLMLGRGSLASTQGNTSPGFLCVASPVLRADRATKERVGEVAAAHRGWELVAEVYGPEGTALTAPTQSWLHGTAGGAAAAHCRERTVGLAFLREACLGGGLTWILQERGMGTTIC